MVTLNPNFHARPILYDIKQSPIDFETFTTTDTYATPLYTWITTFMSFKLLKLTASSANDVDIQVDGSYDGVNFNDEIQAETLLAASGTLKIRVPDFYAAVRVNAKSHAAGKAGVVSLQCVGSSHAQTADTGHVAYKFEQIPVLVATAAYLTPAYTAGANSATVTVEGNPIRARWDGSDPTSTVGHLLQAGDTLVLDSNADIANLSMIAVSIAASVDVTYSR